MRWHLILTVAWLLLVQSVSAQDWYQHRDRAGRFSAAFPTKPVVQSFKQPLDGGEMEIHVFISEIREGDQVFMISYNDIPAGNRRQKDAKTLLEACVRGAVKSRQGKLLSIKEIKQNGYPGRNSVFEGTADGIPLKIWHRCFLVQDRLYQVMAMTRTKAPPTPDELSTLMGSFQFEPEK